MLKFNLASRVLRNNKGMTLMEMLGAVAVLGILAAVIISNFDFAFDKSKVAGVENDMKTMKMSVQHYHQQNSLLPTAVQFNGFSDIKINNTTGLAPTLGTPNTVTLTQGTPAAGAINLPEGAPVLTNGDTPYDIEDPTGRAYFETTDVDPWETPYLVAISDTNADTVNDEVVVYSAGVDKTFDSADDLAMRITMTGGSLAVDSVGFSRDIAK